ncbi:hypothetical protein D3C81_1858830 [compost metagenome]
MGIAGIQRLRTFHSELRRSSTLQLLPGSQGMVCWMVDGIKLKRTVLHQLGVQSTVCGMVQVLKKKAEQIVQRCKRSSAINKQFSFRRHRVIHLLFSIL